MDLGYNINKKIPYFEDRMLDSDSAEEDGGFQSHASTEIAIRIHSVSSSRSLCLLSML